MFQEKPKRKAPPPPRPPPPNITEYNSKSSFNIPQRQTSVQSNSPVEWSTFSSRRESSSQPNSALGSMSSFCSIKSTSSPEPSRTLESGRSTSANSCDKMQNLQLSPVITVSINPDSTQCTTTATFCKPRIIRRKRVKIVDEVEEETSGNSSPPMPTVPPPSPPRGDCSVITPYGIALHEFKATQPGDLAFQENDVIHLLRRVSDDWLYGRSLDREGIFPQDFIRIEVPLPGDTYNATAIYEFRSHAPGNLPLVQGQVVRVLEHISQDWLYGSSNGKVGQFPKCFVR